MKFSLIVCTFKRPDALLRLLKSVQRQTAYPSEILIVDGSPDDRTKQLFDENNFQNLIYYKVAPEQRGLTKQRNFGIQKAASDSDVLCFLDDDIITDAHYFENLLKSYRTFPDALGVGGYITNESTWFFGEGTTPKRVFSFDGWHREEPLRFKVRKLFGLDADVPPGFAPAFSHGRSVGFLPPSGKIYEVEQLMGGVSSFRNSVFDAYAFSEYFEGYGLYEDADFSIRVAKTGKLYLNTSAHVQHYHEASGRPNQYEYGKMVVRNGWYVWRVKNRRPTLKDILKWHAITLLLTLIRFSNAIVGSNKKQAFTEAFGRMSGWFGVMAKPPVIRNRK